VTTGVVGKGYNLICEKGRACPLNLLSRRDTARFMLGSTIGKAKGPAMRHIPRVVIVAAMFALTACNPSSPPDKSAEAGGNAAAPPAPPAPAAPAQPGAAPAAAANGLWGVAEEEDEASHRGLDFIAFNRTGQTVTALAVRPEEERLAPGASEDPWSANVLAQTELADGQRAAAHYEADIELCRWQLRATFADGKTRDYPGTNLCETIRVDLR